MQLIGTASKHLLFWSLILFSIHLAAQPGGRTVTVETTSVRVDTLNIEVSAVGDLRAEEQVIIRPEISGRVVQLNFAEGESVKNGQLLVKLDDAEYQARLRESTATVKLNQQSFNRIQDMYNKKLSSRQAYDDALALLEESRARQVLDQVLLAKMNIHAPFAGTVGLRNISEGAYVQVGSDLITLVKIDTLKLDFNIPERYLPQVKAGQTVHLGVDAYPAQQFSGTIYAINPTLDQSTRTVVLRARLDNAKRQLLPGMFARVNLRLSQRDNALLVPEQAIVPQGNQVYVFRMTDGKAEQVSVTLGLRLTGEVEILSGLQAGDQIITAGQLKIRDGTAVQPLAQTKTTQASSAISAPGQEQ